MTSPIRKFIPATTSTDGLADKRQVLVNCSADGIDRQGDIVVQAGIDTASFVAIGGTVLWQHDPDTPIAKAISIGLDEGQLRSLVQFPDAGVSPKADEIYGLIKAGVVNATSIGFKPVKWEPMDPEEAWGARKYTQVELMEFSFVSVPAQVAATVIARAHNPSAAAWKVGATLNAPIGAAPADGVSSGVFKHAVAAAGIFDHAGFDADDPDVSFARKGFLVYDSANPTAKSSYRLPFAHMVEGRLTVSPALIAAAAARLDDIDIPGEVKAKARAVIDHYEGKMNAAKSPDWTNVKSALRANADPATVAWLKSLVDADKAGRVLSEENAAHVEGLKKCLSAMGACQTKALDSHGMTRDQLVSFAGHLDTAEEHAKALRKAAKKPKPEDDDDDDGDYSSPDDSGDDDVELAAEADRRARRIAIAARA